jgi:hypothetical protein
MAVQIPIRTSTRLSQPFAGSGHHDDPALASLNTMDDVMD